MGFDLGIGEFLGLSAVADAGAAAGAGAAGLGTAAGAAGAATLASATPWATIGLGAGLAGSGLSAVGALTGAQAQKQEALYSGQVAKNNATIANQNAEYATQAGEATATQSQLRSRATEGALTSAIAANGVDVNTGSAADVRTSQSELDQLGTDTVRQNAALQNYGFRTQATSYQSQANLDEAEAKAAGPAGDLAAGADLLSGAGTFGANWLRWRQVSGTGGL